MAKPKSSSNRKVYKSLGQRPNVSKKIRNAVRQDRLSNRPVEDILKAVKFREEIVSSIPTDNRQKALKDKFLLEREIRAKVEGVLSKFSAAGLLSAEAIMAAKTDKIPELVNKWRHKLAQWKEEQKKQEKSLFNRKLSKSE